MNVTINWIFGLFEDGFIMPEFGHGSLPAARKHWGERKVYRKSGKCRKMACRRKSRNVR